MTDRPAARYIRGNSTAPSSNQGGGRDTSGFGAAEVTLAAGMVVVFVLLVFQHTGLYPSIFADEWNYSMGSRLSKLSSAGTPLYLYLFLFRITKHCGSGFLECARILNNIFFVAAAPFIYSIARRVTSKAIAVLVTMLSLLGPINSYTAYFMPEAMYFFVFWLLTWFTLSFRQAKPDYYGAGIGTLLGVLILVKVNAIFLLPGLAAFIIYNTILDSRSLSFREALAPIGSMIMAAAIVRFGIGYLAAGTAGLHILGTKYGAIADSSLTSTKLSHTTGQIFGILRGHLLALALLFGVPLASIATMGSRRDSDGPADDTLRVVEVYCLALIIPLLIAIAYFTASVVGTGPYESVSRLHMRYYNFLFPLFLIVAAGEASTKQVRRGFYALFLTALVLCSFILYSLRSLLRIYSLNLIDSPELRGVTTSRILFYSVAVLGILSLIIWMFNRRRGAQVFLFLLMPVSVLCSTASINTELRHHLAADDYDKAGIFARQELDQLERADLLVVGADLASLYRILFYVDDPKATMLELPAGAPFDPGTVEKDRKWVLLVGDHSIPDNVVDRIPGEGYILFRLPAKSSVGLNLPSQSTVDFVHPYRFGLVKRLGGLSVPQLFGRWSDSREAQIEMSSPLPQAFVLRLTARAFGPNTELPFTIRIGSETKMFRLSSSPTEISLPFTTDGAERLITIEVPQPTSPKQLGISDDGRLLGIALTRMSIISNDAAKAD